MIDYSIIYNSYKIRQYIIAVLLYNSTGQPLHGKGYDRTGQPLHGKGYQDKHNHA